LIEAAYRVGEAEGLAVWAEDEAGPYQTRPMPGYAWRPAGQPARYPHEYLRHGTAKMLTLFPPTTGTVRVTGVRQSTNAVLHPWLMAPLSTILAALPPASARTAAEIRAAWERWQEGLCIRITLPADLPPLRMLLILDNLMGHYTPAFVLWLFAHGILPLYTPLGGSWLNLAESIQRILKRRSLDGQHPQSAAEIIAWLEATARDGAGGDAVCLGWQACATTGAQSRACALPGRERGVYPSTAAPTADDVRLMVIPEPNDPLVGQLS